MLFSFLHLRCKLTQPGKFILNHYQNAAEIIASLQQELEIVKTNLSITDDDFNDLLKCEKEYFRSLEQPPPSVELKKQYIRSLNDLAASR